MVANAQKCHEYKNTKLFWGIWFFFSTKFYAPNRIPHVSKVTDDQLVNSKMLFLQPLIGIQDIKYPNPLTQTMVLRRVWWSPLGVTLLTAPSYPEWPLVSPGDDPKFLHEFLGCFWWVVGFGGWTAIPSWDWNMARNQCNVWTGWHWTLRWNLSRPAVL